MTASNYLETAILNHVYGSTPYTPPAAIYVKFHIGDPGEDGTANPAVNTTRKVMTFVDTTTNAITNDSAASWTGVPATETYTHVSLWDTVGPSGGNCLSSGALTTSLPVTSGGTADLGVGAVIVTQD